MLKASWQKIAPGKVQHSHVAIQKLKSICSLRGLQVGLAHMTPCEPTLRTLRLPVVIGSCHFSPPYKADMDQSWNLIRGVIDPVKLPPQKLTDRLHGS